MDSGVGYHGLLQQLRYIDPIMRKTTPIARSPESRLHPTHPHSTQSKQRGCFLFKPGWGNIANYSSIESPLWQIVGTQFFMVGDKSRCEWVLKEGYHDLWNSDPEQLPGPSEERAEFHVRRDLIVICSHVRNHPLSNITSLESLRDLAGLD